MELASRGPKNWWKILLSIVIVTAIVGCVSNENNPNYNYNQTQHGNNQIQTTQNWPSGPPALITPYYNKSDIERIGIFSKTGKGPNGYMHNGIDFMAAKPEVPYRAVADGTVTQVLFWQNDKSGNWQVNVGLQYNQEYALGYAFEPFTKDRAAAEATFSSIKIKKGDSVKQGDLIGTLLKVGDGAHVHFGVQKDNVDLCPGDFFTTSANEDVLSILHTEQPTWTLCYP